MKTAMQDTRVRNTLLIIYVLAVLVFSAAARAADMNPALSARQQLASQLKTLVGEVAVTTDGRTFLVVSDKVFFELRAEDQDLTAFNGEFVQVNGFEMMAHVGPVYTLASLDPLTDEEKVVAPAPVIVVLQIRELAE